MTLKYVITGAITMTLLLSSVSNIYATGLREDPGDDATEEEAEWFVNGYDSGFAGKYDKDKARECVEHRDQCNDMWSVGCEDALRTEEECGELINNPVEIEDYEQLYYENKNTCRNYGEEDGENNRPYNKERSGGCVEFDGYRDGYQYACERYNTKSTCELKIKGEKNFCYDRPDIAACVDYLHNATNKKTENPYSVCTGAGDPRPNIICPQEVNPEKYCLMYDNSYCKVVGDLCDGDGFVKPEYPYCTYK